MATEKDDGVVGDNTNATGSDRVATGIVEHASARIVVDSAQVIGSESARTGGDSVRVGDNARVVELGPRSIPAHLSSTGSKSTKLPPGDVASSSMPSITEIGSKSNPSKSISIGDGGSKSNAAMPSISEDGSRSRSNASKPLSSILDGGSKSTSISDGSKSSTALGFGPHRSPEPKISTAPGFGPHRSPASMGDADDEDGPAARGSVAEISSRHRRDHDHDSSDAHEVPRFRREALRASAIARVGSSLRRAFRFAFREPRAGLWSMLVAVCAMIVVGVSAMAAKHVDAWTMHSGSGGSMVVYLGEGVDDVTAGTLVAELRRLPGVEHAELVAPEESAKRLQQALGADTKLMDGVDPCSLPASVEVTLAPGVRDVVAMSPTVRALRGAPGVEDVVLDEASEDRTSAALGTVRTVVWTGAALLAGLALIILLATIRLRLDRDPEEQRISHLLGAGPSFLMMPSILAGALLGALAAVIAGGVIVGALSVYGDAIVSALAGPLGAIDLAMPTLVELALFVGVGAALGLVGGGLAGASRVAR